MAVAASQEIVTDEIDLLRGLVPLAGASVVDLGCGNGAFARQLIARGGAASVDGFEVDEVQHARNLAAPPAAGVAFHAGGAENIALPDASRVLVVMMKSLHH